MRRLLALSALLVGLLIAGGNWLSPSDTNDTTPAEDRHPATGPAPTLDEIPVQDREPTPGYERDCGTNGACVFGPAWTDDHDARLGHDGCDTRNNILNRDLTNITHQPDTSNCVIDTGTLLDPFTGTEITFTKADGADVHIDHLYPLALAWDMGANEWPLDRRVAFANDPANLRAVSAGANLAKSDDGPGQWLPDNDTYVCDYIADFLTVADTYDLPITPEDHTTATEILPQCPERG